VGLDILALQSSHTFVVVADEGLNESAMGVRICILAHGAKLAESERADLPVFSLAVCPSPCAHPFLLEDSRAGRVEFDQYGNHQHQR
jgi:hypothetical protein